MITHCGFSSLCYGANGLTPVQHHNASLLTMIKTLGCHVCEVFLFMLANDAHVGAISLITTSVKTLVGPSTLHCPSHSTTPGEWVLVGWRLDCKDQLLIKTKFCHFNQVPGSACRHDYVIQPIRKLPTMCLPPKKIAPTLHQSCQSATTISLQL